MNNGFSSRHIGPDSLRCPSCDEPQPPGTLCRRCGIVFAKYHQAQAKIRQEVRPTLVAIEPGSFPYRKLNQLLLLVFLASLGLTLWSHWKKDQLPPPSFYDKSQLEEPRQTPTASPPFQIKTQGILYTIEPLFDYELDGVVVSLHDSDAFSDIYHFKDWQDFINIRDLCVVWGSNVASGIFRDMTYQNTTWTCWISTADAETAQRFAWDQLSNNHLLAHKPLLQKAIKSAEIGDHVHLSGQLARYSHAGGFQRGTSITRTDTGNGACETIYIKDFRITRKANTGWRLLYRVSLAITLAALLGLAILLGIAPVRAID